jgi:NH3-dependent NAD+ synthetase
MAGGFAVLKDIAKTLVYRLANYRNELGRVIPGASCAAAVGGLRENQTDRMHCPVRRPRRDPRGLRRGGLDPAEIVARGHPPDAVARVVKLIKISEYKRRQSAIGIRITPRGFGKDWRYPITSAWREWEHLPRASR